MEKTRIFQGKTCKDQARPHRPQSRPGSPEVPPRGQSWRSPGPHLLTGRQRQGRALVWEVEELLLDASTPHCDAPCHPSSPGRHGSRLVNIWQRFLMALPVHGELWQCPRQPRSRHPREAGGQAVSLCWLGRPPHTPDVTNVSSVPQLRFLSLSPVHSA